LRQGKEGVGIVRIKKKGISLIEVLIAIFIVGIVVLSIAHLMTFSALSTREDTLGICTWQAALSGIEEVRGNRTLIGTTRNFICSISNGTTNSTLNVQVTTRIIRGAIPNTPPSEGSGINSCALIEAMATLFNKNYTVRDMVCNFQ
jgi:prepilin-type N-terminal cleavage/methylation domain-containing protein